MNLLTNKLNIFAKKPLGRGRPCGLQKNRNLLTISSSVATEGLIPWDGASAGSMFWWFHGMFTTHHHAMAIVLFDGEVPTCVTNGIKSS